MNNITQETIRASAIEYIRRQLAEGKSLARALLEAVDFEEGRIMTLTPTPLSPTETTQFIWGHTPTRNKPERIKIGNAYYLGVLTPTAREQIVETIYGSLQDSESICFLENYLAEAHDPWLQRAKSRVVTNGNEVYHALFGTDRDKGKIQAAIREWYALPTSIGALGRMKEKDLAYVGSAKAVSTEQLAAFARTAESIFVGAYDGEGYVVWNKVSS